ncbi:hypothetical protein QYE76_011045 [Lolium multiflorum]|uniref:F-box domain-containing protein n=1 Tax=Lolium multiflorum TaxID=4521 RepID=A0AAD8TYE7_LOLMU|nr:hypothetical protein QYE76_011045 [Lolium multiflorum]
MENYSLLMGAAAVMKMAVEMAAVSMEKPSGALPRSGRVPEQRLLSPKSWLRDGGGSGRFHVGAGFTGVAPHYIPPPTTFTCFLDPTERPRRSPFNEETTVVLPVSPPCEMEAEPLNSRRQVEPDWEEPPSSLDLISRLPDEILQIIISLPPMISVMLHIIISLLPTISDVSTTLVSKRWRHLWDSIPLNLKIDDDLSKKHRKGVTAVSSILAAHLGPARSISIDPFRSTCKVHTTLDSWFRSSTVSCIENLRFEGGTTRRSFLLSMFRYAPTLRIVSILICYLPEIDADSMLLSPQLKRVMLYDVCISKAANIDRLLARCIALE